MEDSILYSILNPICLHCKALCYACRGLTIKDWIKAKNCQGWEYSCATREIGDRLDLDDYLIGDDHPPYGPISPKLSTPEEDEFADLDKETVNL